LFADEGGSDFGRDVDPRLAWACFAAIGARVTGLGDAPLWERIIVRGIATGDPGIIRTFNSALFPRRRQFGPLWRRVTTLAIFSAALSALRPSEHEPGDAAIIVRWRRRLALRTLQAEVPEARVPALLTVARRVERLWQRRFRRAGHATIPAPWRTHRHAYACGLNAFVVRALFDWTLDYETTPPADELDEHRAVLHGLWAYIDWTMHGGTDDMDDPHIDRAEEFGLTVLRAIAARVPLADAEKGRRLWEPILALGPAGEFTVEHLIGCFFLRLYRDADPTHFIANWDAMLAYVFAPGWNTNGRWYRARTILAKMLGIHAASQIEHVPAVSHHVAALAPYFEKYATEHLKHDASALRDFARFLAARAGAALRAQALAWLNAALEGEDRLRDESGAALAELVTTMLAEDAPMLASDQLVRGGLLKLIGHLVRTNTPMALTLQDRARHIG
jgi:hypothetical protein